MKKILILTNCMFFALVMNAQQKEGKVVYSRTTQMQIRLNNGNDEIQNMLPKSRTDNFELHFANNQSIWRQAEKEMEDEAFGSGGIQIRMIGGGADDVVYNDFNTGKKVEQREMFDKKFIIDDSIRPLQWKMTGETKVILNHTCMKAVATTVSKRIQTYVEDGKIERKEVDDTARITAWFASDIPVSAGPAEYQGQLPGLILELDVNDGRQTFVALEITQKPELASIKAPTGKKRYTQQEYVKERDKMLEEMQKNNNGGRVIRF